MIDEISDDEIDFFRQVLLAWFIISGRQFPWRKEGLSNYQLIISEVLLQRTKAETIDNFYEGFITQFPNWQTLVNAGIPAIATHLKPIGLYNQRAKRIFELALYMVEKKGVIPVERTQIENVPFMGQYIANAVELLIHNKAKPLLDVNMARVLERYFGPRVKADLRYDSYLQELSHRVVQHANSKEISWAILDFAAKVCRSKNPKCSICSLSINCKFYKIWKNNYI